MNYSERIGGNLTAFFSPEGPQTFEALTPVHLLAAPTLARLPRDIGDPLTAEFYARRNLAQDWPQRIVTQEWLADEVSKFERERLHVAFDEHEINERAQRWAHLCARMMKLEVMQDFARDRGITPPEVGKKITRVSAAARLQCERWWRRQLRKTWSRQAESHLRAVGLVHKRRQLYASDRCTAWRKQRKVRNAAVLRELVAVSDVGDQLNLFEVAEASLSNPALRRAELMTRMKGFEDLAEWSGHGAIFVTETAPSEFHARHSLSGDANEKFAGHTPRDAQAYLCKVWSRVRAAFQRAGVMVYGFRVAEPHHDATPHWHMVLFGCRRALVLARRIMAHAWRKSHREDFKLYKSGAWGARFDCKVIDKSKGSATGYIATYVAKNIDGFQVGGDYETNTKDSKATADANATCARVAAWATTHGIRQFQQIGGPSVGLWRELRRLRSSVAIEQIEAARKAADAGEWANFVAAVGGIARGRNTQLELWKVWSDEPNAYGEAKGDKVEGVQCADSRLRCISETTEAGRVVSLFDGQGASIAVPLLERRNLELASVCATDRIRTRNKVWRIQRKAETAESDGKLARDAWSFRGPVSSSPLGLVSITVRGVTPHIAAARELNPYYSVIQSAPMSARGVPWPS